jgi:PemK-like, MazF-like toxin of type II toxin-antitoxin system
MPDQGDVLLVPVPFTDLTSQKRRPVIVISNNDYNRATADIVVVAMTSDPAMNAYTLTITQADMEAGTLKPGAGPVRQGLHPCLEHRDSQDRPGQGGCSGSYPSADPESHFRQAMTVVDTCAYVPLLERLRGHA